MFKLSRAPTAAVPRYDDKNLGGGRLVHDDVIENGRARLLVVENSCKCSSLKRNWLVDVGAPCLPPSTADGVFSPWKCPIQATELG